MFPSVTNADAHPIEELPRMLLVTPDHTVPSQAIPPLIRGFRPDIQGLRAIAIGLVVLAHAEVPGVAGGFVGVDVFFVISGFLITRGLFNEVQRSGRISLIGFYGRRMRRLLPAAVLVVLATILLARFVLPASQLSSLMRDVWYSAIYGINYHLAAEGTQYMNAEATPSALQHFWSLAVEEQFYVVWPVLIGLCVLIGRKRYRLHLMVVGIVALSAITLYWSVTVTATNASMGYFALHTRAWELGIGALIALSLPIVGKVPGRLASLGAWVGLAMILTAAILYSENTLYPGFAALLPVLGTALLIAGGTHRNSRSPETVLLDRAPMQYMGKVSYAWYLWHWPMLILLPLWAGHTFGWLSNLELVLIAFWFAVLTYFLENAAHRSSWSPARWVPVGFSLVSVTALSALLITLTIPTLIGSGAERQAGELRTANILAVQSALKASLTIAALPKNLTPGLLDAPRDQPVSSADGCHALLADTTIRECRYGAAKPSRTMVLLGDSHAQQWLGALVPNAVNRGWQILTYTKAACPVAAIPVWNNDLKRMYTECEQWRPEALAAIKALDPDLTVVSQSNAVPWTSVSDTEWSTSTIAAFQELDSENARVVYIGDTPQTEVDPVACLETHLDDAQQCAYPRAESHVFPERATVLRKAVLANGFDYIDPTDFFCTPSMCPPVVGNIQVRRDRGHITNTYATWLAPMFTSLFEDEST